MRTEEFWQLRKAAVTSDAGMVSSQHHLASDIGASILADGGNAVDAAIATGLALGIVEPWMSGIGGGGFMTIYNAKSKSVDLIEFGMQAPATSRPSDYPLLKQGENSAASFNWPAVEGDKNIHGPLAIATPGYLKGIDFALKKFGSKSWTDIIEPACKLAEFGLPIDWFSSGKINLVARGLNQYSETRATYLADGLPPTASIDGSVYGLRLGKLAATYRQLQTQGAACFYTGSLAKTIAADLAAVGSKVSLSDLANYKTSLTQPNSKTYAGAKVYTTGALTSGASLLHALTNLENNKQFIQSEKPESEHYVAYTDALISAYKHRLTTMGADSHAGNTTHISVSDKDGNVVALTQTIMSGFGSRIMLPQTGILMNNGMMWFDPTPNKPNSVAGGRFPLCNMCPTIVVKPDGKVFSIGACGGRKIFPAVFQMISFMLDFNMDVDACAHQARVDNSGTNEIILMDSLPKDIVRSMLAAYPQAILRPNGVMPNLFALPQIVEHAPSGKSTGACFIPSPHAKVAKPYPD